jgi:dolichyl-phosphate-mannose-protein mannosyltransferase
MISGIVTRIRAASRLVESAYGNPRGWWVTGALAALAAALRLPNLGWPHAFSFDETYYAKDAFSLLQYGYERAFLGSANESLLAGNTNVFGNTAEFVVHPPLGKWAIALGEAAFGMNPFGWRIVMAVLGIAAVALLHRTALRLTGNVHIAALAGLFMAIDGEAIVLSRTALLDQTLMFFVLATFWALLRDRDAYEHTLIMGKYLDRVPRIRALRPWRLAAIVFITCAFATKWSALWFAIGFALLALWWDVRARRQHEVVQTSWLSDLGWILVASVIGVSGYLLSWIGWFLSADAWDRTWNDGGLSWLPQSLRALIYYHQQALHFHVTLTSDHPYKASPFGWLLQIRPTSFFYETYAAHSGPCTFSSVQCASEVLALGNVVIWWFATATITVFVLNLLGRVLRVRLAVAEFEFDARRPGRVSWDAIVGPLVGVASGWLPWVYFHDRTTFTFYTIVFTPFICLLAAQGLALFATRRVRVATPTDPEGLVDFEESVLRRELAERAILAGDSETATFTFSGAVDEGEEVVAVVEPTPPTNSLEYDELHPQRFVIAVIIVALAVGFSAFVLPIWTGSPIAYSSWHMRMLIESWI